MEKNYDFDKMVEDLDEYELSLDSNSDDTDEEYVTCVWCGEEYPKSDCRLEADIGYLCSRCISAIKSRGETLTFVENIDNSIGVVDAKEKIRAAVNQVFDEAKEPLYADVFDANLFIEHEETPVKQFACYFRDEYLGDVSAKDADGAYAAMEERWPFLPYSEYDGIANVKELVEDCAHSEAVEEDFTANPAKTLADVMDFSDYQTIDDLIDGGYPEYEIEYDDLDLEIESEGCEDYYDPSNDYGHGQRCWTNYGKLNHWTYLTDLTINDFVDFLHKPIDAITLDEVKRINANDFDSFVAERYRAEAEQDAEENWDDNDVSWDDDYGYPDYDDWDD